MSHLKFEWKDPNNFYKATEAIDSLSEIFSDIDLLINGKPCNIKLDIREMILDLIKRNIMQNIIPEKYENTNIIGFWIED